MKFGIREICDVVLRAKSTQKIGNKIFYKNEPVCYFDTLKTSTLEGAATTVYATGGRGNARLLSWDGERTLTFTMEDALISPIGLSILTGAGLLEASENIPIVVHTTEIIDISNTSIDDNGMPRIELSKRPKTSQDASIYVMGLNDAGEVITEPFLYSFTGIKETTNTYEISFIANTFNGQNYSNVANEPYDNLKLSTLQTVLVDYYFEQTSNAFVVNISPDEFGGSFYLEGSTLWRDQASGKDLPAEFIIPNCRVQSNFTFSMSSSGDPSSFTFTMDAFPDYTRWDRTKKVLSQIQVLGEDFTNSNDNRTETWALQEANIVNNVETGIYQTYNLKYYSCKYLFNIPTTAPEASNTTWDDTAYGFEVNLKLADANPEQYIIDRFFKNDAITYNTKVYRQSVTENNLVQFANVSTATLLNNATIQVQTVKSNPLKNSTIKITTSGLNPSDRHILQIQAQYANNKKSEWLTVCLPAPLEINTLNIKAPADVPGATVKNTYTLKLAQSDIDTTSIADGKHYYDYIDALGWLSLAEGTGTNAGKYKGYVTTRLRPTIETNNIVSTSKDFYSNSGTFNSVKIYLLANEQDTPSANNLVKEYSYYEILKNITGDKGFFVAGINSSGEDSYLETKPYGVTIVLENNWYKFEGTQKFPTEPKDSSGSTKYNLLGFTCTQKTSQG